MLGSRSIGSLGSGATTGPPASASREGSRRLVGFDGPQEVRLGAGGGHGAQEYCQNEQVPTEPCAYAIGLRIRFRGITERQGMVWRGAAGWAEWSPFLDYDGPELVPWLRAADEAAELGWPEPLRTRIPVNATIPAVGPDQACRADRSRRVPHREGQGGRGRTDARPTTCPESRRCVPRSGTGGLVRVDANGAWGVEQAERAIRQLARFGLEYVEQPCRTVEELAELRIRLARNGIDALIAADESIRRAEDPYRVAELEAADVAVLKVQPLGGVRACLEIAERIGLPVVVSSALETSIGIRAGVALAAALPQLPFACGLNTVALLADDLVQEPLIAVDGVLDVRDLVVDDEALLRNRAGADDQAFWQSRLMRTRRLADG